MGLTIYIRDNLVKNVKNLVYEIIYIELGNLRLKYKLKKKKVKKAKKKSKKAKPKKVPGARLCKNRDPRDMLAEVNICFYRFKAYRSRNRQKIAACQIF